MLDDILAAVDPEVATQLMDDCVMGLLKNKTRILVTHHPKWVQMADCVIVMAAGRIAHVGSFSDLAAQGVDLAALMGFTADENAEPKGDTDPTALGRSISYLSKASSGGLSPQSPGAHTPGSRRSTKEIKPDPNEGALVVDEDKEQGAVALEVNQHVLCKLLSKCMHKSFSVVPYRSMHSCCVVQIWMLYFKKLGVFVSVIILIGMIAQSATVRSCFTC